MKPQLQITKMEAPSSTEKALYVPIKDISIGGKLFEISKYFAFIKQKISFMGSFLYY
jgi:hypothetical protein